MVSCYAFIMRWLLLSLLSICLRLKTSFSVVLNQYLEALTLGWVVPLEVMELTPINPSDRV